MKCPLCHKELKNYVLSSENNDKPVMVYQCDVSEEFATYHTFYHYSRKEYPDGQWEESVNLSPYHVVISLNKTCVMIFDSKVLTSRSGSHFKEIFSIDYAMHLDNPGKLRERIKLLTVLS